MSGASACAASSWRALACAASLTLGACARAAPPPSSARPGPVAPERADSWLCRGLIDRFLGLPSAPDGSDVPAALAGRWWIRSCEVGLSPGPSEAKELTIRLDGPGWYWVDFEAGDLALHQQVPFELAASIGGGIRFAYSGGVASLWFKPSREPSVRVKASTDLDLHGTSVWGSLLHRIPLLPIRRVTAERLSDSAAAAIGAQIQRGITVTYDLAKGQADMALGALRLGETPRRVFEDGTAWIENDRLALPPGATQVFGPLEPLPVALDVLVERGPGIAYRALCTRDMPSHLREVAAGKPERIPARVIVASGTLSGAGPLSKALHVQQCPYYLVVFSARAEPSLVAFRLRAAPG